MTTEPREVTLEEMRQILDGIDPDPKPPRTPMPYLTERDRRVLRMRLNRTTYARIAEELHVTPERAKHLYEQAVRELIIRELNMTP